MDGWWMDGEPRMPNVLHTQTAEWKHFSERDHLQQGYVCLCVDKIFTRYGLEIFKTKCHGSSEAKDKATSGF